MPSGENDYQNAPWPPAPTPPPAPPAAPQADFVNPVKYAGFWDKFLALCFDMVILAVPNSILMNLTGRTNYLIIAFKNGRMYVHSAALMYVFVAYCYFAFMESSPMQATFGKRVLRLIVTDLHGNRISFQAASLRFLASIISALALYIGYISAAWNPRKQCWHDRMVGTLVVKRIGPN